VPNVSKFELASQLQPGESVCYCARRTPLRRGLGLATIPVMIIGYAIFESITGQSIDGETAIFVLTGLMFLVAMRWSTPSGEIIATSKRIISRFNSHAMSEIYLDEIRIAQIIESMNYKYCKITLNDGSISRVVILDEHNDFANCLPSQVALYRSTHTVRGGRNLSFTSGAFFIFGMLAGIALGLFGFTVSNTAFDGVTNSQFWSVVIVVSILFGPMIACAYFGTLLGISLVFAQIKGRFSLQEAKDLAVYGMALDFDAPSRLTRFMSKCLRPHLERTLSKAYGQIVRLY
jgi:hypothetical protein